MTIADFSLEGKYREVRKHWLETYENFLESIKSFHSLDHIRVLGV